MGNRPLLVCSNGALPLVDPSLQDDPRLMRRLRWAQRLSFPSCRLCRLVPGIRYVAQRLQLPGSSSSG